MTNTDTTTQAAPETAGDAANTIKADTADAANAVKTDVTNAVDAVKADVTGDASGVGKALAADAGEVKTFDVDVTEDVQSDIEIAKAHAQAAITHIEATGFISDELTKAKALLGVCIAYIEKHI